jgi:hypothetical protein
MQVYVNRVSHCELQRSFQELATFGNLVVNLRILRGMDFVKPAVMLVQVEPIAL